MNLFTKQKQTHRHRKQTYGYQRGNMGGGINQEFWNNIYTLVYKVDKQQGPTVQHREPYSIFCKTYIGKESEKEYIFLYVYMCVCVYIYIELNHFALHLKLTPYCKSTILPLNKQTIKTMVYPFYGIVLGWPTSSFGFFCNILRPFGQPNIQLLKRMRRSYGY